MPAPCSDFHHFDVFFIAHFEVELVPFSRFKIAVVFLFSVGK